jgi:hypothetical protein
MARRGNREMNCPAQQRHDWRLDGEWIRSKVGMIVGCETCQDEAIDIQTNKGDCRSGDAGGGRFSPG